MRASASRWFYYKTYWDFKYCRVQVENVSHWLTDKQLMSNHVSLFEDMRFSIGTPITQLGLA